MNKKKNANARVKEVEEEKEKKAILSNKLRKKILIVLAVLLVLAYLVFVIVRLIKNPTDQFLIENGKIYQEEVTQGYVIREETVVKGENYKNGMEKITSEGERVSKGESIFRYYTNGEDGLNKQIQDLDVSIQKAMENETEIFNSDVKILDKQIESKLDEASQQNNLQKILELKKEINTLITKKATIAGDLSPSGSYIKSLRDQRNALVNQLNSGSEYIAAPIAGIVSYRVDGLESVLTPDDFSKLNKKTFTDLDLKTGQLIASSEESGKVVNNFKCYVACMLSSDEAKNSKVGDKIKIRLSTSDEITAKIVYKGDGDDSELLILEVTDSVEYLINYRKVSIDVIWWSSSGLKVPNSSIVTDADGKNYVVRDKNGYLDKILVKVVKQNSKNSIIDNYDLEELEKMGYTSEDIRVRKVISLYDQILLKPSK